MEQDHHDRFVAALKPIIPAARLLIPKHFEHLFAVGEESTDWEVRYPGVKVMTEFEEVRQMEELHPVGSVEPWHTAVSAKLDAVLQPGVESSMSVRDITATPPVYGGGIGTPFPLNGGVALTGGPDSWDHSIAVVGLIRARVFTEMEGMHLIQYSYPGIKGSCEFAGLSMSDYTALMHDIWSLRII